MWWGVSCEAFGDIKRSGADTGRNALKVESLPRRIGLVLLRIVGIILILIIGIFLIWQSWLYYQLNASLSQPEKIFLKNLKHKAIEYDGTIDISELTSFPWDTVCFLGHYSFTPSIDKPETLEKFLPAVKKPERYWDQIPDMSVEPNSEAFIFTVNGDIVQILLLPFSSVKRDGRTYVHHGDVHPDDRCLEKDHAVLMFKNNRAGWGRVFFGKGLLQHKEGGINGDYR
jgi:ABC-type nickel/cobalt efflux system permease component RcnA